MRMKLHLLMLLLFLRLLLKIIEAFAEILFCKCVTRGYTVRRALHIR